MALAFLFLTKRHIVNLYTTFIDMKKLAVFATALIVLTFISSCKKEDNKNNNPAPTEQKGAVTVEFDHKFGTADFALNSAFTTKESEQLTFTNVRYYITNFKLQKTDGTYWVAPESYYLVDVAKTNGTLLTIADVPAAEYKGVSYMIGVDSTRNVSGAQTGALDPANGMFWSWNSGYIFMKFEGTSPQSSNGNFSYHVGGFSGTNNAIQENSHAFGATNLQVKGSATSKIHMLVDMQKLFDGEHETIKVATFNMIHMPGANALKVAENFHHAIEFGHVHN